MWYVFLLVLLLSILIWYMFFWNRKLHIELKKFIKCIEENDYKKAQIHLDKAKEVVKKLKLDDPRVLFVRLEEARMAVYHEQFQRAEAIMIDIIFACTPDKDKSIALLSNSIASKPKSNIYNNVYSRALLNLAELLSHTGDNIEAENFYQIALKFREDNYGPDSRDVVMVLNRYADFLCEQKRLEEARDLLDRADRIICKS